ncbi:MAG: acyl-CoA dehydrogenase [Gammaproteobacteria bacterium]|nr:acyl-CoA dehydrogenase [Gammaproteobacteria bacterium]
MLVCGWILAFLIVCGTLSYHRASLIIWTLSLITLLGMAFAFHGATPALIILTVLLVAILLPLNLVPLRRRLISKPLFNFYKKIMPSMSRTEREAIGAGTVTWEGDLFRGDPDWDKLLALTPAKLSTEEQAFIDGPVDELCRMIDDWKITHNDADMSPETWQFLKDNGFFALIIPKAFGGKEFSAFAHSQIIAKISGRSVTVSSTVAVPNSLGPAELLLHYGTEKQKNYYLPRLARGEEIPCFALTSPEAGSDAGAMTDYGIVCKQVYEGEETIGIRLNWDKRYITLAPVATVIGLAFKLYDPDHLIGSKVDIGITCALIPRETTGVTIGRRHFPLNTPFMNGPIKGKDVFIPLDWIIGGVAKVGAGWKMLMECLAAGRAISLPANAIGGAKVLTYATGAYARIRKQFNVSIGKFEGIEEPLARIAAYTYIMDAARTFASATIDAGEKPSVASAIVKYHVTEMGRKIACDGMDISGGKGICLGPKNYIGRGYEAAPIAITVEGANILTRSLIIFGQGAMRCHPYVLAELEAGKDTDAKAGLIKFDRAVIKHVAYGFSNVVRSLFLGLTSAIMVRAPQGNTKRYYQQATRFSSGFALMTDVSMLVLGGNLKRRESISGRLGDILSHLYLLSAVLKQYEVQGHHKEDFPLIEYASKYCLFQIQESFSEILRNFPNRIFSVVLRGLIFPWGMRFGKPSDRLNHKVAQLIMAPTAARQRLSEGAYLTPHKENVLAELQDALLKTIAVEDIEKLIKTAHHDGKITGYTFHQNVQSALENQVINQTQYDAVMEAEVARKKVIAVDDFTTEELARVNKPKDDVYAQSNGTHG